MNRLEVLLVGQTSRPEFRLVEPFLRSAARCRQVETLSDGYSLLKEKGGLPDLILLLQAYPGQFPAHQLDRIRTLAPSAPVVVVLGPWSEGEGRSGKPLPGTGRIYWYQWPARWGQQLRRWQEGKVLSWGVLPTSVEGDRLPAHLSVAAQARTANKSIGIFSLRPSQANWLFEGLKLWGLQPIWIPAPTGPWPGASSTSISNSPHPRGIPEPGPLPADRPPHIRQARPTGLGGSVPLSSGHTSGPICPLPSPNPPLAGTDQESSLFRHDQENPPSLRPFWPEHRRPNPCSPEPGSPDQSLPTQGLPKRTSLVHSSSEQASPEHASPEHASPEHASPEPSLPGGIFPLPSVRTVVFDGTDAEGEEEVWLRQLARWLPEANIVLLVNFPRPELWDRVQPLGVKAILGKPLLLGDLVWHLEQLENEETI